MHQVFAYGSLVGTRARDPGLRASPAYIKGWARSWSHGISTKRGHACALSVVQGNEPRLDGVVLECDDAALDALDQREVGYTRVQLEAFLASGQGTSAWLFVGDDDHRVVPASGHRIWLSYLRVVLAGYRELGGHVALESFYRTTGGWDVPIEDDAARPNYSRAFTLSEAEQMEIAAFLHDHGLEPMIVGSRPNDRFAQGDARP